MSYVYVNSVRQFFRRYKNTRSRDTSCDSMLDSKCCVNHMVLKIVFLSYHVEKHICVES